jgi:hypothetical protein
MTLDRIYELAMAFKFLIVDIVSFALRTPLRFRFKASAKLAVNKGPVPG